MNFRIVFSLILGMIALSGITAAEPKPPLSELSADDSRPVETGMKDFETARRNIWADRGTVEDNLDRLDRAAGVFDSIADPAARTYLMARVELYRGRLALNSGGKGDARDHFELAMDLASESSDISESSEAMRVRADAGSSWMITKGLGGIIRMAPRVQEWSDRALELDPENDLAVIISCQGQINAPRSAGGNPAGAAGRLEELLLREDLDEISVFWGRLSLALAYDKIKNPEKSAYWCDQASVIFPDNPLLEDCRQ